MGKYARRFMRPETPPIIGYMLASIKSLSNFTNGLERRRGAMFLPVGLGRKILRGGR